jgi:hypothetical protein
MSSNWQPQVPVQDIKAGPIEGGSDGVMDSENQSNGGPRKKIVVVGLGMVGISFMCVLPVYLPLRKPQGSMNSAECFQRKIDEARCKKT